MPFILNLIASLNYGNSFIFHLLTDVGLLSSFQFVSSWVKDTLCYQTLTHVTNRSVDINLLLNFKNCLKSTTWLVKNNEVSYVSNDLLMWSLSVVSHFKLVAKLFPPFQKGLYTSIC